MRCPLFDCIIREQLNDQEGKKCLVAITRYIVGERVQSHMAILKTEVR